jgi:hypothetical protein
MTINIVVFLGSYLIFMVHGIPITAPSKDLPSSIHHARISLEELGGGYGGDMLFPNLPSKSMSRGVAYNQVNKWPSGIIPYDISAITNAEDLQMIENAMQHIMYDSGSPIANSESRNPCVRFRPKQASDATFLTIVYGEGCNAHAGYWANYPLKMTLQKDATATCFHSGIIQHELLHVLGFNHEHERPDRDNYVEINYGNIDSQWHYAFEKQTWGTTAVDLKTSYDYGSIMHYGENYFSNNVKPTIVPKQMNASIGNREKLSPTDVIEIRRFYECQS